MLTIFGVPVSQPVRAVVWPCLIKKTPFKFAAATPGLEGKKGTRSDAFLAMNPSGQIPAIDDGGFKLGESMAIMSYLGETRRWTDLWPSDPRERARVNMYLHYHHRNVRDASVLLVAPLYTGTNSTPDVKDNRRKNLQKALKTLDLQYLGHDNHFLAGKEMTLADLACYSELGQLLPQYHNLWDFSTTPNLQNWFSRMAQVCVVSVSEGVCVYV
jgi:glutathione S-transferase